MLTDPLFILVILAALATVAVLVLGLVTFARGGEFHKRNSNKLMRWRIGLQGLAIVFFLIYLYFRAKS
ncbi:MAG: twin transmembrane helix small protein [Rhodobacteraceae bacterium]|nr:twin transmembrane helix small protein [Paracoccaceae bacterium]